jgi:hypothetical protein
MLAKRKIAQFEEDNPDMKLVVPEKVIVEQVLQWEKRQRRDFYLCKCAEIVEPKWIPVAELKGANKELAKQFQKLNGNDGRPSTRRRGRRTGPGAKQTKGIRSKLPGENISSSSSSSSTMSGKKSKNTATVTSSNKRLGARQRRSTRAKSSQCYMEVDSNSSGYSDTDESADKSISSSETDEDSEEDEETANDEEGEEAKKESELDEDVNGAVLAPDAQRDVKKGSSVWVWNAMADGQGGQEFDFWQGVVKGKQYRKGGWKGVNKFDVVWEVHFPDDPGDDGNSVFGYKFGDLFSKKKDCMKAIDMFLKKYVPK